MTEYRYTTDDRQKQLATLAAALRELIPVVAALPEYAASVPDYEAALQLTERLLRDGGTQAQLTALANAVPDLFLRHREWCPPVEQAPSGDWREPEWFTRLEARLQPVLQAAGVLRVVGYY